MLITGLGDFLAALNPDPRDRHHLSRWSTAEFRWLRYWYLWAFYDQTAYHGEFSDRIKREMGSYRNIQPILNRIRQIVEFHVTHLMGGRLDMWAGDGKATPTALPIVLGETADKAVNRSVGKLWQDSKWQRKKSVFTRTGAALGDFALELIDDSRAKCIRMRVVHPAEIRECWPGVDGHPARVVLERPEIDPAGNGNQTVIYKEIITREVDADGTVKAGGTVHYQTFRDDNPYAWPGTPGSEWDSPFPFIPIVIGQHIDQGFPWGVSEIGPAVPKSISLDDQASIAGDSIRRMGNGPWLLSGATMRPADKNRSPYLIDPFGHQGTQFQENSYTLRSVQVSSREDMPIIECPSDTASMKPLVYPLPISEVVGFLSKLGDALEQEYPELQVDLAQASGAASGRALRVARQKVSTKIEERRSGYDEVLAAAQRYGLIMGGELRYDGYKPFGLRSLESGNADHQIGERSVFGVDPLDTIEISQARASAAKTWTEVGLDYESVLEQADFDPKDIKEMLKRRDAAEAKAAAAEASRMDSMMAQSEGGAGGQDGAGDGGDGSGTGGTGSQTGNPDGLPDSVKSPDDTEPAANTNA
jgi:hypothetical protein